MCLENLGLFKGRRGAGGGPVTIVDLWLDGMV